jgi:hypothetical protein
MTLLADGRGASGMPRSSAMEVPWSGPKLPGTGSASCGAAFQFNLWLMSRRNDLTRHSFPPFAPNF